MTISVWPEPGGRRAVGAAHGREGRRISLSPSEFWAGLCNEQLMREYEQKFINVRISYVHKSNSGMSYPDRWLVSQAVWHLQQRTIHF